MILAGGGGESFSEMDVSPNKMENMQFTHSASLFYVFLVEDWVTARTPGSSLGADLMSLENDHLYFPCQNQGHIPMILVWVFGDGR